MAQLASLRTHTDAVVARLRQAATDAGANLTVFDGGPPGPDDAGWGWQGTPGEADFRAYAIVYPLPGGTFDGPLGAPSDDADLTWQVTCVGADRGQAEWALDVANAALVNHLLEVPGRQVWLWADMAGGGARRDDTVQPAVFIATPRYRCMSSPTAP